MMHAGFVNGYERAPGEFEISVKLNVDSGFEFNGYHQLRQARDYFDAYGSVIFDHLVIDHTGAVIYDGDGGYSYSGRSWMFVGRWENVYKIKSQGNPRFENWYLGINEYNCRTMLTDDPQVLETNWKVEVVADGKIRLKNAANMAECTGYLKHEKSGNSTWLIGYH